MNNFEILSLLISLVAAAISTIALVRARKTNRAFLEFEKIHAELSQQQIDALVRKQEEANRANVDVRLVRSSSSDCRLWITNSGPGTASNITVVPSGNCEYDPLIKNDYERKIPYPLLNPGGSFEIVALVPVSVTVATFPFDLRWTDQDGTERERTCVAS